MRSRVVLVLIGVVGVGILLAMGAWLQAGGEGVSVDNIGDQVQTLPRGQLPVFAKGTDVAALYRFALERQDVLQYMPCMCGCGGLGHTSNRSCYIKSETAGRVTFTSHAAT